MAKFSFSEQSLEDFASRIKTQKRGAGFKYAKLKKEALLDTEGSLPTRPHQMTSKEKNKHKDRLLRCVRTYAQKARYKDGSKVFKDSDIVATVSPTKYLRDLDEHRMDSYEIVKDDPRYKHHIYEYRDVRSVKSMWSNINVYLNGDAKRENKTTIDEEKVLKKTFKNYKGFPAYSSMGASFYKPSAYPQKYPGFIYLPYIINNQPIAGKGKYVYWNSNLKKRLKNGEERYIRFRSERQWRGGKNKDAKHFIQKAVRKFNKESAKYCKTYTHKTYDYVNKRPTEIKYKMTVAASYNEIYDKKK